MPTRILVIDDEVDALKMFGYALHRQGYEVLVAQNGPQGLEAIDKRKPDLVILDIMMPDMDGYEVCRSIRANPETRHLPVIMLTAKAQMEDKLAGFETGADDYISKPVAMAELLARVKALLQRASFSVPATTPESRIVAFLGAKGGVGTTTLAVNTGMALLKRKQSAILLELRPWGGAAAEMLGLNRHPGPAEPSGQDTLETTATLAPNTLVSHFSGLGLLPAPVLGYGSQPPPDLSAAKVEAVIQSLRGTASHLLLDLGTGITPGTVAALEQCSCTFLVTEQCPLSLRMARETLDNLAALALTGNRIELILNNRSRTSVSLPRPEQDKILGRHASISISPSPEALFQADREGTAVVLLQPDSSFSQSIDELVQAII